MKLNFALLGLCVFGEGWGESERSIDKIKVFVPTIGVN